jgi:hypothetical protein
MILSSRSSLNEQTLRNFIEKLGHIPASASICVNKISKLPLNTELQFFVNKHNLCWFADDQFLRNYNYRTDEPRELHNTLTGKLFSTNEREIKLSEIL